MSQHQKAVTSEAMRKSAVLVTFNGGYYNWKRRDKKAEIEYLKSKGVETRGAIESKKNLFAGCDGLLAQIKALITEARAFHYDHTMPYPGAAGICMNRIVPVYTKGIVQNQNKLETLLESLTAEWDTMIHNAQTTLGPLFNAAEYPALSAVREACYVTAKFSPIPMPSDYDELTQVEESLKDKLRTEVADETSEAFNKAIMVGWDRLRAAIANARENLHKTGEKQRFRTEWFDNLTSLLGILEGLNLSNDPALTEIGEECAALLKYSPEELKQSLYKRDELADTADAIHSKLDGIFASFGNKEAN